MLFSRNPRRPIESLESRLLLAATDITSLTLFNAETGQAIGPFGNNSTIDYSELPTNKLSIRAVPEGTVGSVRFGLDGNANFQTENFSPYSIRGDDNTTGRPIAWTPTVGTHTLVVRAFTGSQGGGTAGVPLNVTFEVTNGTTTPPPTGNLPTVWFSDTEGDAKEQGIDSATFVVSRTGSTASPLVVSYTMGGTATNGVDYVEMPGAITIPAGKSSVNFVVTPKEDTLVEGTETIAATLASSSAYVLGTPVAISGPLLDNDTGTTPPPGGNLPVVTFSKSEADAHEQALEKATWTISRTGSTSSPLVVTYSMGGTAINGVDYNTLSGSITIPAGASSVNLVVTPKEDTLVEGTETITATLTPSSAYTLGSTTVANSPLIDNDTATTPGQNISDITWTRNTVPRAPIERTEPATVQIGSKLYMIGGFTAGTGTFFPLTRRVDVYDAATRTYTQLASLPSQAAGNHSGAATDGTYIYVISGQVGDTYGVGTNTSWRYDIASNTWSQFVSLPEVRFAGGAFIENGWLHFAGGSKADRETPATDHWAINLSNTSGGWVRKTSLPRAGDHFSHAFANGKHYFIGGEHGHHGLTAADENGYVQHNDVFQYNADNDTWSTKAPVPTALSHSEGTTLVINNKIVVIGGLLTGGGNNTTNKVHVYDPVANSWKLLNTRYPKRLVGGSGIYWNGKIYVTNGFSPDESDRQVGYEGTVKFI